MKLRPGLRRACRLAYGRRAAAALVLAVVAGLAVRLVLQRRYTPLASDSVHYVLLARALASGQGFVSGGSQHPDLSRSPMLPLLTAGVVRATGLDALSAGRFTVAFTSALLVVPLFFLTRRLFGALAALAALPLGAFSCTLGTAIHVMPAAPYLLFAVGAIAAVWSAGRRPRPALFVAAGALAGAAALARTEGVVIAIAVAGWAVLDVWFRRRTARSRPTRGTRGSHGTRGSRRLRTGLARGLLVASAAAAVYGPYAVWASWRLGRLSPIPGMQYVSDIREVCDRLSLRDMDGPDLPWSERATYVVSADRKQRVLETWFDTRVLLPPAATFAEASRSAGGAAPIPETPTLHNLTGRRIRIIMQSVRELPFVLREGHYLPVVPVALGMVGLVTALARRSRRRAVFFVAVMGAASFAPLFSHIEARFLYAPFALGLTVAAGGWGWIAARLLGAGGAPGLAVRAVRAVGAAIHVALVAGVAASGVGHTDGVVEPLARQALHKEIAAEIARVAGDGPVLAVQGNAPFWAERPYRAVPIGSPSIVLDYAHAQAATCLVLEGDRDLRRRPELDPLTHEPAPPGFHLVLKRPSPQGGDLRVFRIESAAAQGSVVQELAHGL